MGNESLKNNADLNKAADVSRWGWIDGKDEDHEG
jgi:hypothetical protein